MKKLVTSYTFDASAKTIDSADFTSLEKILLITNVTDGIIIYNFADAAKGGTLAGTVLTLDHDTTSMDDADKLQIFVDIGISVGNGTTDTGTQRISISSDSTGLVFSKLKDASGNNVSVQTPGDAMAAAPTTTLGAAAFNLVYNGTNYVRQRGDATDGTLVNLGANNDVTVTSGAITETNSASIKTAVETIDNAISGSEMQVDVVAALPAGTNNIGDVDVATLPVAFDTGTRSATTQRVTIATDDLVPVSLASVPAHNVTNAGTFATQATLQAGSAQIGHLEANQSTNVAQVNGVTTSTGNGTTDTGTQRVSISSDSTGLVFAKLKDASGNNTSVQTMGDTMSGAPTTTLGTASFNTVYNGTNFVRQRGDATDGTLVNLGTNNDVTATGNVAHDGADSGAPVKVGAKASTSVSGVTLVANGDRTDLLAGVDGVQIVRPNSNLEDIVSGNASNTDGSSTQVIASSGAGIKTYLTDVTVTNSSSGNIIVELKDGSTVKWTFPVPANAGVTHSFTTPLAGTAATAWNFDPSTATTTVYCSAAGFKSKI